MNYDQREGGRARFTRLLTSEPVDGLGTGKEIALLMGGRWTVLPYRRWFTAWRASGWFSHHV